MLIRHQYFCFLFLGDFHPSIYVLCLASKRESWKKIKIKTKQKRVGCTVSMGMATEKKGKRNRSGEKGEKRKKDYNCLNDSHLRQLLCII